MDNKKFGNFISSLRKEKGWTQCELADKLNVTDKAISKWERGLGFPDIKTIEPLSEALGVTVLEIMRSERIHEECVTSDSAKEAINNVIDVITYQRDIERRNILIMIIAVSAFIMTFFLIDVMQPIGYFMICFPIICLVTGILLLITSLKRKRQSLHYTTTLLLAIMALMIPIVICIMFIFAFALGGPVPS